jgi:hypothetical protein
VRHGERTTAVGAEQWWLRRDEGNGFARGPILSPRTDRVRPGVDRGAELHHARDFVARAKLGR